MSMDALAALKADYVDRLGPRLDEIQTHLVEAKKGRSLTAFRTAFSETHKIHGTARSYGFAKVGDAAARLEQCLSRAQTADAPPEDEVFWQEVMVIMEEIITAFHSEKPVTAGEHDD